MFMIRRQPRMQRNVAFLPQAFATSDTSPVPIPVNSSVRRSQLNGWKVGQSLFWQLVAIVAVWIYVYQLHSGNDGLWYQGDAPRHAANGLFWWDLLSAFTVHPIRFAMT